MDSLVTVQYNDKKHCRRPSCNKQLMMLEASENWHRCPVCKDVQPITTNKPLFWIWCPFCTYPRLISESENKARNIKFTCHRCEKEFSKTNKR
jgi:hypothetical protein